MWLNITLNEESFTLNSRTVKCLTLVSRYFANSLKNYIQQNYWFDLSNESGRRLTYYSPMKQTQVMDITEITPSTKRVVFHERFNNEVDNLLSPHITHIEFGFEFDQKVNHLPPNLTHLRLDTFCFNQPVDQLPQSLTHLTIGEFSFNHPVDHLPPNLTHLEFCDNYNRPLPSLPSKVEQVTFGMNFNHPIDHLSPHIQFQRILYDYNRGVWAITPYQYKP